MSNDDTSFKFGFVGEDADRGGGNVNERSDVEGMMYKVASVQFEIM